MAPVVVRIDAENNLAENAVCFTGDEAGSAAFGKVASGCDVTNVAEPLVDAFTFPLLSRLELLAPDVVVFSRVATCLKQSDDRSRIFQLIRRQARAEDDLEGRLGEARLENIRCVFPALVIVGDAGVDRRERKVYLPSIFRKSLCIHPGRILEQFHMV